ncbi:MAG: segregation and condensation protein A, partial [Candidatus Aminicenantales bacterium]
MEEAHAYEVNLEVFQGPLDLLLFLIRKRKIDIHDIPIATITREYLAYLNQKDRINLEREAEFLLMASLLIYIKSQMLLPREKPDDDKDPRQVLVERLLDFQKIQAACRLLREKEDHQLQLWTRTAVPPAALSDGLDLGEVSVFDLAEAFLGLLRRKEQEPTHVILARDVSVEKKMKELLECLREHGSLDFLEYFNTQETVEEALMTFFCLLE